MSHSCCDIFDDGFFFNWPSPPCVQPLSPPGGLHVCSAHHPADCLCDSTQRTLGAWEQSTHMPPLGSVVLVTLFNELGLGAQVRVAGRIGACPFLVPLQHWPASCSTGSNHLHITQLRFASTLSPPCHWSLCWGKRIAIHLDLNHSLVKCQLTHFTSLSLYFLFCKMGKMLTAEVSFIGWNGNIKFLSHSGQ